jgi:glucokinase
MASEPVIAVDVGGTKVLTALVAEDGAVLRSIQRPTVLGSQGGLLAQIEASVLELVEEDALAVGVGIPSKIDYRTGEILGSVNIPLAGIDLRRRLAERLEMPVDVDNDANLAALGESRAGAGRYAETMVMLTLGTGCGGGLVIGGKLYRGWAEFGHLVIDEDGLPCQGSCTGRGHLEAYVTGPAATKAAREAFGPDADAYHLVARSRARAIGGLARSSQGSGGTWARASRPSSTSSHPTSSSSAGALDARRPNSSSSLRPKSCDGRHSHLPACGRASCGRSSAEKPASSALPSSPAIRPSGP